MTLASTAELAEFCGISKMKSIFFTRIVHAKGGVHVARRYGTTGPSGFRNVMLKKGRLDSEKRSQRRLRMI
jgi:hypothetical protein